MKLVIERGKTWEVSELSPKTIALDGAVQGPHIDPVNQIYSFDHHANCLRLVTKATCAQVYDALLLGLNPDGFDILVNDVDGDTVLSVWLLDNYKALHKGTNGDKKTLRELVEVVSNVDAHGPAYPLSAEQKTIYNIFYKGVMAPEAKARYVDRNYGTVDLRDLLADCLNNMNRYYYSGDDLGVTAVKDREGSFEVTHRSHFAMVKSDMAGFQKCYDMGITAAILYSECPDGSIAYTVGKKSEFVAGFNVPAILKALSAVEPGWGGGSTIGGAPRNPDGSRSHLTPDQVFMIVSGVA